MNEYEHRISVWMTVNHDRPPRPKSLGFRVKIRFSPNSALALIGGPSPETLRNVTEIHMGYRPGRIAFESDVHGTGNTYDTDDIAEYEVFPETERAARF